MSWFGFFTNFKKDETVSPVDGTNEDIDDTPINRSMKRYKYDESVTLFKDMFKVANQRFEFMMARMIRSMCLTCLNEGCDKNINNPTYFICGNVTNDGKSLQLQAYKTTNNDASDIVGIDTYDVNIDNAIECIRKTKECKLISKAEKEVLDITKAYLTTLSDKEVERVENRIPLDKRLDRVWYNFIYVTKPEQNSKSTTYYIYCIFETLKSFISTKPDTIHFSMHVSEDSDPTSVKYFEITNLTLQKDANDIQYEDKRYVDLSKLINDVQKSNTNDSKIL